MQPITLTLRPDHPIFRALGGDAYQEATSDLVMRARNARAMAQVSDPYARILLQQYHAASSGSSGKYELAHQLRALGVTDFDGMIWDRPSDARVAA